MKTIFSFLIAVIFGILGVIYYVSAGLGSKTGNVLKLQQKNTVKEVTQKQNQTITVKCKNGEQYEIVYKPDQTNYRDLVYEKCGE